MAALTVEREGCDPCSLTTVSALSLSLSLPPSTSLSLCLVSKTHTINDANQQRRQAAMREGTFRLRLDQWQGSLENGADAYKQDAIQFL